MPSSPPAWLWSFVSLFSFAATFTWKSFDFSNWTALCNRSNGKGATVMLWKWERTLCARPKVELIKHCAGKKGMKSDRDLNKMFRMRKAMNHAARLSGSVCVDADSAHLPSEIERGAAYKRPSHSILHPFDRFIFRLLLNSITDLPIFRCSFMYEKVVNNLSRRHNSAATIFILTHSVQTPLHVEVTAFPSTLAPPEARALRYIRAWGEGQHGQQQKTEVGKMKWILNDNEYWESVINLGKVLRRNESRYSGHVKSYLSWMTVQINYDNVSGRRSRGRRETRDGIVLIW